MSRRSVVFMGTPNFAKEALAAIMRSEHKVENVFTQSPKPVGRKHVLEKSPVYQFAEINGISVHTPSTLKNDEVVQQLRKMSPDVVVVAAYGFILPESILSIPKYGCINIHASILPRWRGAAPIQHAIMAGDQESGISIMKMDCGMDTGDIIEVRKVGITQQTTYGVLLDSLSQLGADMIVDVLSDLENKLQHAYKQPSEGVTIARKLTREMEKIDWSRNANDIERNIRAFHPAPNMWTTICGHRIKIISSEVVQDIANNSMKIGSIVNENFVILCGNGTFLRILEIQPSGGKKMPASAFLNGHRNIIGSICE